MIQGSCLCGAIWFELDPQGVVLTTGCYCANCRKVSGSQFGVYLQVKPGSFRWLAGEDEVATYESSPGNLRGFCKTCGCVAPLRTAYGAIRVPGGALDKDPGIAPDTILHASAKAGWCATDAATTRFEDSGPADFWRQAIVKLHG